MSPPDPRGWKCRLFDVIVPDTWVPLGAPRQPDPPCMIFHVSEAHHEAFERRIAPVPTMDGLTCVLWPLFERVEDEETP